MPYPDENDQAPQPPDPTEELSERGKHSNRNVLAVTSTKATAIGATPQQAKPDVGSHDRHPGKRRDILPADVISIVGGFAIAAVPATVAAMDFSNGHLYRGSSFAGMAFLIAGIPSVGFLFDYLRSGE